MPRTITGRPVTDADRPFSLSVVNADGTTTLYDAGESPSAVTPSVPDLGIQVPYVITGVANIRNPAYNIPTASDVNVAPFIQAAINRGIKRLEWDYDVRTLAGTVTYPADNFTIAGQGFACAAIQWAGGDLPIFAPANYGTTDAAGKSNITIRDMLIGDNATSRPNNWAIDLSNGVSNRMIEIWYNNSGGQASTASDKFGVRMGARRGSPKYAGETFVPEMVGCRMAFAKVDVNTTDWTLMRNKLWGNGRDKALIIGGGGTWTDNQLVPGVEHGIYILHDLGQDVELVHLHGGYIDGSYLNVFTGIGIGSDFSTSTALINSEIFLGFWRLNKEGIRLKALRGSTVIAGFTDCDSDDTGEDDIYLQTNHGNTLITRHRRDVNAPKKITAGFPTGGAARVNKGRPMTMAGDIGFPKTTVIATSVGDELAYLSALYTNKDAIDVLGGSYLTQLARNNLPNATQFIERTIRLDGEFYGSNGAAWRQTTNP